MTEGERAIAVRVMGRVQGVGFRAFAQSESTRRGIRGWVVNQSNGSVEVALQGNGQDLSELVALLRRGPPGARVDSIDVQSIDHARIADIPEHAYSF